MFRRSRKTTLIDADKLDAFFDALDHLDEVALLRMRASWKSVNEQDREDAWTAVRTLGARDGFAREIDRVRNRAMAWATRGTNAIPYRQDNNETWAEIKMEAAEAIVDIALAAAFGDQFDEKTRAVLLTAWGGEI